MRRSLFIFLFTITITFTWGARKGESVLYQNEIYHLKTLNTIIDTGGKLTINDVLHAGFSPAKGNFGITKNTIWLKVGVVNLSPSDSLFLEIRNPTLNSVTFYKSRNNQIVDVLATGRDFSFSKRPDFPDPNFIYPLRLNKGDSATVFIRIQSNSPVHLPIYVGNSRQITEKILNESLVTGVYMGIVVVMFFYNFFLYLAVRDKSYLYYIIYIFLVGLAQFILTGYADKYFWPQSQWLSSNGFILSGVLSGVATGLFTQNFLRTKRYAPLLHMIIYVMIGLYISGMLLHFAGSRYLAFNIVNILAMAGSLLIIYTAFKVTERNYAPARFFLVAFSVFLVAVIIYVLRTADIIPYNNLTAYVLEIGSAIQITLLSFALADKINTYRREQTLARRESLRISKENERLVREQNILLEKEVKARTSELENANLYLEQTLAQLKTAQSQLVDSEKMASLGQLTAGVAHEINNPINFVASNIKPLELDIKDIFTLLEKYRNIDTSTDTVHQLKEIEAYINEIDLPYIGEEIQTLLNGIREGAIRTAEIVKNLKNFSRIDQSTVKYVNLNTGLKSTMMLVRNTFPENLVVEMDLQELPKVECLPGRINQIFMNIITNSIQAINYRHYENGELPKLTLKSWQEGENVKVLFKDNGIGMTEEVISKMYDPFFTTKDVGEGTGLGMSIVKSIIDSHRGALAVSSIPGAGSEFILTLPIESSFEEQPSSKL